MGLWQEATRVALDVLEREAVTARRGARGTQVEYTGKMVAAIYQQEDARTVDGERNSGLCSHMIVMNVTQRGGERWTTVFRIVVTVSFTRPEPVDQTHFPG